MAWYYAAGTEQCGPVEHSEFEQLVRSGAITADTLVWREGMGDWKSYGELTGAPPPAARAGIVCSECGRSFAADEVIRLGSGFVCAACKPAAMQKLREGVASQNAEQVRQEHIKHEASVRSIGILYFLGAAVVLLAGMVSLAGGSAGLMAGLFFLILGAGQIWVGVGLRKLRSWARIPTGILSGIGLLGFPLGTLINAYILYLVFSQKGKTVFSEEYQRVIEETPHIKYRTSIVVWILLGLIFLLIGLGLLVPFLARSSGGR